MCGAVIRVRRVVALREIASKRKKYRRAAKLFLITIRKQSCSINSVKQWSSVKLDYIL